MLIYVGPTKRDIVPALREAIKAEGETSLVDGNANGMRRRGKILERVGRRWMGELGRGVRGCYAEE
jgi:hypothetical protein